MPPQPNVPAGAVQLVGVGRVDAGLGGGADGGVDLPVAAAHLGGGAGQLGDGRAAPHGRPLAAEGVGVEAPLPRGAGGRGVAVRGGEAVAAAAPGGEGGQGGQGEGDEGGDPSEE